ncbi:hypothetical protein [Paraburkholderia humisilvae]|uniref:Lipoprotein n=1 Tax=Paraburkholderia humisilvae TaxID=627669 RepID=A0A6J5EC68_9BURK|nr:hypothetical protein [Paraburkholderia humisilvae]CAB3762931.1 hypothetical protein LMG29542_04459 [Paraburkholderia humisilvae]
MVMKILKKTGIALVFLSLSPFVYAYSDLPDRIRASQIKEGCYITFLEEDYAREQGDPSRPYYDALMKWSCKNGETTIIDRYDVEGASPEIVTVLFWKKRSLAVLVKWSINSHAADFQGDFYKVYVYRYVPSKAGNQFRKEEGVMKKFGEGWDGEWVGKNAVRYDFKDAASIKKRLNELGYLK